MLDACTNGGGDGCPNRDEINRSELLLFAGAGMGCADQLNECVRRRDLINKRFASERVSNHGDATGRHSGFRPLAGEGADRVATLQEPWDQSTSNIPSAASDEYEVGLHEMTIPSGGVIANPLRPRFSRASRGSPRLWVRAASCRHDFFTSLVAIRAIHVRRERQSLCAGCCPRSRASSWSHLGTYNHPSKYGGKNDSVDHRCRATSNLHGG